MVTNEMSTENDIAYLTCPTCNWVHEGVPSSSIKEDLKYSHCCNCFEDYINFEESTRAEILKHTTKHREFGKILLP